MRWLASRCVPTARTRSGWPPRPPWRCTTSPIGWPAMPEAPQRLDELRREGEAAIGAARSSAELEELRVRLLGRRAELTSILRSIGELPPEQRGPVGRGANEAKRALEELLQRRTAEL